MILICYSGYAAVTPQTSLTDWPFQKSFSLFWDLGTAFFNVILIIFTHSGLIKWKGLNGWDVHALQTHSLRFCIPHWPRIKFISDLFNCCSVNNRSDTKMHSHKLLFLSSHQIFAFQRMSEIKVVAINMTEAYN